MKDLPWETLVVAGVLAPALVGVWGWQQGLQRQLSASTATEPWQQVRERYPMPAPFKPSPELSEAFLRSVVRANPFSPTRRQAAQDAGGEAGEASAPSAPPPPQFIFKGRIVMGTKQRAVLEDAASKKTFFLQVGQEVAGFKVLDITENQVVLSNPNSQEPLRISLTQKEGKQEGKKKETSSSSNPGTRAP